MPAAELTECTGDGGRFCNFPLKKGPASFLEPMFGAGMPAWSSLSATLSETVRTHRRALVRLAIAIISLGVLFGPLLVEHATNAASPRWLNDDSRMQIWP